MNNSHSVLLVSLCIFSIYFADVIAGAYFKAAFLSDVAAVLMLVLSSVCFTVAIVGLERREKADIANSKTSETLESLE